MARKAHLIGICGKGMSGLAILLKQSGWEVTGSDTDFHDPVYSMLKKNGIDFASEPSKENITKDIDLVVVGGKRATLDPETNTEVKAALELGMQIKSVPEVLNDLSAGKENTVIAGSFGKSTVTALVSHCLIEAKRDPSYFIGAVPLGFEANAHLGNGKNFILEGDEYPASNFDATSKFLYLRPENVLLISGEHDHINIFPTEESYVATYKKLVALLPPNGILVAANKGKNVTEIAGEAKCKIVNYGFTSNSTWHPRNIVYGMTTAFDLYKNEEKIIELKTILLGNHNVENIVGVSAFLLEKNLITKEELQQAIENFAGVSGRLDLKTSNSSVLVYEGYGSTYSKAKSIFDALALHFPNKKLITVFEPHSGVWSYTLNKPWYKNIFDTTEKLILLPPPPHRANTTNQMNFEEIINEIKKSHNEVFSVSTEQEALEVIEKATGKDDIIVLISSGSLLGLTASVPRLMDKKFPK